MGNFRKLRTVWMAAAMALILPVLPVKAEPAVLADAPSGWALEDVGYAKLYQLTDDGLFGHYQTDVTKGELHQTGLSLLKSLAHRLDNSAVTDAVYREEAKVAPADPAAQATRLDAVETLYQVIAAGNPGLKAVTAAEAQAAYAELKQLDTEAAQAAAYLAASGIVQGRGGEGLQLAAPLSREELLTLSRRTFEWVLQETGVASKGLVWKVSGGKSDVYVLGSIHIGDVTLYPLDKQL